MKRLLLPLLAAINLPSAVNAGVDPEIHRTCLKASDYVGFIKVQTEGSLAPARMIIKEDASIAEENLLPDSHAYVGNGYCQRVYCDIGGARLFASGHDRRLGGKG